MILPLVAVALLAWWLHKRGELIPTLKRWGAVAALVLLALRFLETGNIAAAVLAGAGAAFWGYATRQKLGDEARAAQARRLLGVGSEADAEQVHAAWRRALATAHPDAGGSSEATAQATAARDLLLARLARR